MAPNGNPDSIGLRHLPALDGLRGVAVAAVVAFHLGHLRGGWLGVDVFFVLSGFLITSLLLHEHRRTGSVSLRAFWARRARRLLPALFTVLAGVALYARFIARPAELHTIRVDVLAALTYTSNWVTVFAHRGYWQAFTVPSPLNHVWSLAIEEQFYLVWPLVVVVVLRRWSARVLGVGAAIATVALAALGMALYAGGASASRVYAGTDTRAPALLVGAVAAVMAFHRPARYRGHRALRTSAAAAAAAGLALALASLDGQRGLVYHGVLPLCSLAAAVVLWAVARPDPGPLGRVLQVRPLRALGTISYGVYLWHWPVLVALRRPRVDLLGWPLLATRLAAILALSVASYVLVEQPLRRRGLRAWRFTWAAPATAACVGVLAVVATVGSVADPIAAELRVATAAPLPAVPPPPSTTTAVPLTTTTTDTAPATDTAARMTTTTDAPVTAPVPRPQGRPARVMLVGDSVAFSIAEAMSAQQNALGLVVADRAAPACGFGYEPVWYRLRGERPTGGALGCPNIVQGWRSDVATFRPDAVVMLWGRIQDDQRLIRGRWYGPCDEGFRVFYEPLVERAVADLSSAGATVYLALSAYSSVDQRPDDAGTDCVNNIYREVASRGKARILDLHSLVCPTHRCVQEIGGVTLREDGLHYWHGGGLLASRWVSAHILSP